jgi:hypothetical protein
MSLQSRGGAGWLEHGLMQDLVVKLLKNSISDNVE